MPVNSFNFCIEKTMPDCFLKIYYNYEKKIVNAIFQLLFKSKHSSLLSNRVNVHDYVVVSLPKLFRAIGAVKRYIKQRGGEGLSDLVFVDIGSGLGHTLQIISKVYNFKKLVGIEIDRNLCLASVKKNIPNSLIIESDALTFNFNGYHGLFYFYNPMPTSILVSVIHKIQKQVETPIFILINCKDCIEIVESLRGNIIYFDNEISNVLVFDLSLRV